MVWMKVPYTNFHNLNQDWIIRYMAETRDYVNSEKFQEDITAAIEAAASRIFAQASYVPEETKIILSWDVITVADPASHTYNGLTEAISVQEV